MKKVHVVTWGCQMNEYDSDKLTQLLTAQGWESTAVPEQADLLLLNTCSIREKAQEKLFHQLGRWRPLKAHNPSIKIGVGGCVATQEGEDLLRRAPYVDFIFGPQTLHRVPELIKKSNAAKKPMIDISFPELEKFDVLPLPTASKLTAAITIMEGCNKYCTYCIVPYTRGYEVSRSKASILEEVKANLAAGAREIMLLGQNVNAWQTWEGDTLLQFPDLIKAIAALPNVLRIKFITSHPIEFTPDLIELYGAVPSLSSHLHLPVQSGSDQVLQAMNRGHTALEYRAIINRLKLIRPDLSISSDFIVGFPGETRAEFEKTLRLAKMIDFDVSYSFLFSPRPGTPAIDLPDPIPEAEKKQWLHELQAVLSQSVQRLTKGLIGKVKRVLVEAEESGWWIGKTDCNRDVRFKSDRALHGQLIFVYIIEKGPEGLIGREVQSNGA